MTVMAKKALLRQPVISVCNPDFPTAQGVEFIGTLGFDVLFIDCEHSATDFKLVNELARAARLVELNSVVRPWSNDPGLINRYLSCGAGGIQVPHIHNTRDANAVIDGLRRWGDGNHEEKLLVMMVESKEAVENLPALLKIGDIDVFYFGQNDLAESMGLKGQRKHPAVQAAVEDSIRRVADAGRVAGMNVQEDLEAVTHFMRLGLRWVNVHQKNFIARGAKAFLQGIKTPAAASR
jgi:4-hydroxy-2-oxoheptanedioate aldolase